MGNTKKATKSIVNTLIIDVELLHKDPQNVNKQDRATYKALKENILENGFDEPLLVISHPSITGEYLIVGGNHRFSAAVELGYKELPCVVQQWDLREASLQGVRRNFSRGVIDKVAFTHLVDELQNQHAMSLSDIQENMGFNEVDAFADFYQIDKELVKEHKQEQDRVTNNNASKVKMIENLEIVISHIMEEYGDTLTSSFLIFPTGGRKHMLVSTTNSLKNVLTKVAAKALERNMDLNTVLSGLLTIGLHNTDFLGKEELVKDADEENETDPEDTDFDSVL